jgi:hypothetical protein
MTTTTTSTGGIFIAPTARSEQLPVHRQYRLKKEFMAVHFDRGGHGHITVLPKGAELQVVGFSCISECLEVGWDGERYSVFEVDLLGSWAKPIQAIPQQNTQAACA